MSQVDAFQITLQKTGEWLRDIRQLLEWESDQRAYLALRAVLHTLRDRLPVVEAVHLGSQLPMLVRGFYYEAGRRRTNRSSSTTTSSCWRWRPTFGSRESTPCR